MESNRGTSYSSYCTTKNTETVVEKLSQALDHVLYQMGDTDLDWADEAHVSVNVHLNRTTK